MDSIMPQNKLMTASLY